MQKSKERLKGAIFGGLLVALLMVPILILARVWSGNDEENSGDNPDPQVYTEPYEIAETETQPEITTITEEQTAQPTTTTLTAEQTTQPIATTPTEEQTTQPSTTIQTTQPTTTQPTTTSGWGHVVPRQPARSGGPQNPPITAQNAVELAYNHLIENGVSNIRFDYVYMDLERGIWVWSVEFDGNGRSYEFYIDVNTGAFVQSPQLTTNQSTSPPVMTSATTVAVDSGQSNNQNNRPQNPNITRERAIEIAYAHLASQGINATFRSDSGISWERGQWVWELLFRTQGERMPFIEFYINVDNGSIVKMEWDD